MRRPVSDGMLYAPKLSTCFEAQEIKETGNEEGWQCSHEAEQEFFTIQPVTWADRKVGQGSYPQVALLRQVKGLGTLIALTFLLMLEDPHRLPGEEPRF